MSKQVELFMEYFIAKEPEAKKEYLKKIERVRKQKTIHVGSLENLKKRYGLR